MPSNRDWATNKEQDFRETSIIAKRNCVKKNLPQEMAALLDQRRQDLLQDDDYRKGKFFFFLFQRSSNGLYGIKRKESKKNLPQFWGSSGGKHRATNSSQEHKGRLSHLTSLFKFRLLEFGSRPMAQSRQSTSGIVAKVGFLPGTKVTMQTSKPEVV